jgi:hypothetical protein
MILSGLPPKTASAASIPKLTMVIQPAKEYKPGDRISFTVTSPNYQGKVQYRVILYNGTTKTTSELWKTPKTGYYYTGWMPAGNYKFNINWPVTGMAPGAYSLTVLVRRVGSKTPYDSFVKTAAFWITNPSSFPITGTSAQPGSYGTTMIKDGDWIYYHDYAENGLTKIKYDGTGKKKLSSGIVERLVIDGDWLYFIISEDVGVDKIRRVKKDGTGNTQLFKNDFPNDIFSNLVVANGKLYFVYNSTLFSSNLDGTNKQMVYILGTQRSFTIYNNQIYYNTYNPDGYIFRVNLDCTGFTRITNVGSYDFTVDGNWIYYVNGSDGDKLYRASISGETYELPYAESDFSNTLGIKDQVIEKISDDEAVTPVVKDGWVYYLNRVDNYTIYKVRIDGSGRTKLTNSTGAINNVIGNWLFFSYGKVTYRIKTDGTNLQKMFK